MIHPLEKLKERYTDEELAITRIPQKKKGKLIGRDIMIDPCEWSDTPDIDNPMMGEVDFSGKPIHMTKKGVEIPWV